MSQEFFDKFLVLAVRKSKGLFRALAMGYPEIENGEFAPAMLPLVSLKRVGLGFVDDPVEQVH